MIRAVISDLSKVLLFRNDNSKLGQLNDYHEELLKQGNYDFWKYFMLNKELLNFYKKISSKISLYILTSRYIQEYPPLQKELKLISRRVFSAARLGISKNKPELYKKLTGLLRLSPNEIIFVDDFELNIKATKKAGFHTILFKNTILTINKLTQKVVIQNFKAKIQKIVEQACILKNKYTNEKDALVNYACIFCQSKREFKQLLKLAEKLGHVVKQTPTGPLFHIKPLKTIAGDLRLLKIRKPDPTRPEEGDADFTVVEYERFKKKHLKFSNFKLIKRPNLEMIELVDKEFNVRAYFSHPPVIKLLGIR